MRGKVQKINTYLATVIVVLPERHMLMDLGLLVDIVIP